MADSEPDVSERPMRPKAATASTAPAAVIICGGTGLAMQLTRLLRAVGWPVRVLASQISDEKVNELLNLGASVARVDYRVFPWRGDAGLSTALGLALVDEDDDENVRVAFRLSRTSSSADVCVPIALRIVNEAIASRVESAIPNCIALRVASIGARAFVQRALDDLSERPRAQLRPRSTHQTSDTVMYVHGQTVVLRKPRRLHLRGSPIAYIIDDAEVVVTAERTPDVAYEVVNAGAAKAWRGRAHWTWIDWLRWHTQRALRAPARFVRRSIGASVFLRLLVVLVLTLGFGTIEAAVEHRPLLEVLSISAVLLPVLLAIVTYSQPTRARYAPVSMRRQLLRVPNRFNRWWNRYFGTEKGPLVVWTVTTVAVVAAVVGVWWLFPLVLVSRVAASVGFGCFLLSCIPAVTRHTRASIALTMSGAPLVAAALTAGHVSPFAVALSTAASAVLMVAVRFARRFVSWLDRRRSLAVVFGVGTVGSQVIRRLVDQGIHVIAVDREPTCPYVAPMRRLGVDVVAGYEDIEQALESLHADRANLLFAVADADAANLECAILLEEMRAERADLIKNPKLADNLDLRMYVRSHQAELDEVLRGAKHWYLRTVSALAAVTFAKALAGEKIFGGLPVKDARSVVVAEVAIGSRSLLNGAVVRERRIARSNGELLPAIVLMVVRRGGASQVQDTPSNDPLSTGDRVIVIASSEDADRLLASSRGGRIPFLSHELLRKIREIEKDWISTDGSGSDADLPGKPAKPRTRKETTPSVSTG
jgi:Trk K+ transport system NAD-binding subunit